MKTEQLNKKKGSSMSSMKFTKNISPQLAIGFCNLSNFKSVSDKRKGVYTFKIEFYAFIFKLTPINKDLFIFNVPK